MLFAALAVGFLVVRLVEEVDRLDDESRPRGRRPLRRHPAGAVRQHIGRDELGEEADVVGLQRANLVLVLLITQAFQVLLLSLAVFAFFLVFGAVAMKEEVLEAWIGTDLTYAWGIRPISRELVQVSTFLAAFSGLYFAVYAITDETYRGEFFTAMIGSWARSSACGWRYRHARDH